MPRCVLYTRAEAQESARAPSATHWNRARWPSRHAATAERLMTEDGTRLSEAKDGPGGDGNRARWPSRHAATAERLMTEDGTRPSEAKDGPSGDRNCARRPSRHAATGRAPDDRGRHQTERSEGWSRWRWESCPMAEPPRGDGRAPDDRGRHQTE